MEKKITIQDIAQKASVSISTVSRVLNGTVPVAEPKRSAVLTAVAELNYRPNTYAQSLARGQSLTIGILTQNVSSPFYDAILRGVLQEIGESDYSPIFADGYWHPTKEKRALQTLLDRRVDGLIVLGGSTPDSLLLRIDRHTPLIVVGRTIDALAHRCLSLDDFQGGSMATTYLAELGHQRIAHITGLLNHQDAVERREGYAHALRDAGLEPDPELIVEGDFSEQSGVLAVEMLLERGRTFSAIFAANDQMAFGARLALFRRGIRVPDDVSLIGFDDQPLSAYMTPPLTTVRQPAVEIGARAGRAILALLQDEQVVLARFPAQLVVRESTGPHR